MSSLLKRALPALPRSPSAAAAARCLASVTTIEESKAAVARASILAATPTSFSSPPLAQESIQLPQTQSLQQLLPGLKFSNAEFQAAIEHLESKGLGHRSMTWDQRVVWGDHDQFGHVNHVRYVQWFESARALYFSKIFGPDALKSGGLSMILSNLSVRYRRPIQGDDTVIISQGAVFPLERPDRFTLRMTAYSLKQKDIVTTSDQLCVVFDYAKGKPTPVPQPQLSLMQEYAVRS